MNIKISTSYEYSKDEPSEESFILEVEGDDLVGDPIAVAKTYLALRDELIRGIKKEDK